MVKSMATGLRLREATYDDAETLAVLVAEMDIPEPHPAAPDRPQAPDGAAIRAILHDMAAYPFFRAYLLEDDSGPIGTFSLMIFASPSHRGTMQAMLDAVVVTSSRRGMGIGKIMIERAIQLATIAGCYKMNLSSNLKRTEAHRFYESLGFRQHGISFGIDLPQLPVAA